MNILRNEIRMYWKSSLTWALSLAGTVLFFMALFTPLAKDMEQMLKLLKNFPPELLKAMGIENINFGGAIGFYSFTMTYVVLAGAVQAMNLGLSVLSAEVRDKTADFLYPKPVSRREIITVKMLAVLLQIVAVNIFFFLSAWLILVLTNSPASGETLNFPLFLLLTGTLMWLQIFFACLGFAVSALLKRVRTVLPVSMGVVFFFYFLFVLNQTLDNAVLAFLSPFSYFELGKILIAGSYEVKYLITSVLLSALLVLFAARSYLKKDLPSI